MADTAPKGYTSRELLYLGMTYFSTVLPEHEQHQQRLLLELQWQCQQQLHQHQRVPPRWTLRQQVRDRVQNILKEEI